MGSGWEQPSVERRRLRCMSTGCRISTGLRTARSNRADERRVADAYERGSALNAAAVVEVDDVIDPADTRRWIVRTLNAAANANPIREGRRPYIDSW